MKKLQIQIPIILPEVPDEKDRCVNGSLIYFRIRGPGKSTCIR